MRYPNHLPAIRKCLKAICEVLTSSVESFTNFCMKSQRRPDFVGTLAACTFWQYVSRVSSHPEGIN